MRQYRLLDLFCGPGGCSMGYSQAGFSVTGVDISLQPSYPFEFIQTDAMTFDDYQDFDVITASPPCQLYSIANRRHHRDHPDLVPGIRQRLIDSGKIWVIENVPGAPLNNPMMLCGSMFSRRILHHRLFESNIALISPGECNHVYNHLQFGTNTTDEQDYMYHMDCGWMRVRESRQAIPPYYTKWIGVQLIDYLNKSHDS